MIWVNTKYSGTASCWETTFTPQASSKAVLGVDPEIRNNIFRIQITALEQGNLGLVMGESENHGHEQKGSFGTKSHVYQYQTLPPRTNL